MWNRAKLGSLTLGILLCACSASSPGGTVTAGDGGAIGGGSTTARMITYEADGGYEEVSLTNISCSFDGDNNALRIFQGRYCTSAATCYTLRVAPPDGGDRYEITRRPDGGFLQRVGVGNISTSVHGGPNPTADILMDIDFGRLAILGCPAS